MLNKILITGGSGKIGSHFIKSFSDQYQFRIFDLHPPKIQDASIEYFQGNLTDKEYLIKACENVSIVIHLGGGVLPIPMPHLMIYWTPISLEQRMLLMLLLRRVVKKLFMQVVHKR